MTEDTDPRLRRVNNEWHFLQIFAEANPDLLKVQGRQAASEGDRFRVTLNKTWGISVGAAFPTLCFSHLVELLLPRFFPAVPLEAKLMRPVFHPNVDPENGFVCLWDRTSPGDTVVRALRRLQQIIVWQMVNLDERHVIQPEAAHWYSDPAREMKLPLSFAPLLEPPPLREPDLASDRPSRPRRSRLSPA